MTHRPTSSRDLPSFDSIVIAATFTYFFSSLVGVPLIQWFNDINPWIIVEKPFFAAFTTVLFLVVWARRQVFNLTF